MPSEQQDLAWKPTRVFGEERVSRWLILCDHASNVLPPWLAGKDLGLPAAELERHIAYDIGAAGVSLRLAQILGAPVVMSNFSRLVIDPNRGEDDPTLVRRIYDETIIPGNRHLSEADQQQRRDLCYRPYHETIARMAARRSDTVIVSIHSFTPQLRHKELRPWHIGLLFADDTRLSLPLADLLAIDRDLTVGMNQPYSGYLAGDTIDRHAIKHGRHNTLVEIRNDLISDDAGQHEWAERLGKVLPRALRKAEELEGG